MDRYGLFKDQADLDAYIAKFNKRVKPYHPETMDTPDEGPESDLQNKIVAWAKNKGYPCLSLRQSKNAKTMLTPGWPDVVLALPAKRVVFIELKSKKGRLSAEQKNMKIMFLYLQQEWYEIRSFSKFLEVIEKAQG